MTLWDVQFGMCMVQLSTCGMILPVGNMDLDEAYENLEAYPLVNIQITMENHHVSWVNQRTKWAMFNSFVVCLPGGNKWTSGCSPT
jgi:hypothetical protein